MSAQDNFPAVKQNSDVPATGVVPAEISPALFKEFLDNQTKELELKNRQLELEKQKDNHAFEWAKDNLDAQVVDREKQRVFQLHGLRNCFVFATIMSVLFVGLLISALIMNKDQVALEIIKAVIFIASGGAGGYAIGRHRSAPSVSSAAARDTE